MLWIYQRKLLAGSIAIIAKMEETATEKGWNSAFGLTPRKAHNGVDVGARRAVPLSVRGDSLRPGGRDKSRP
jgi:hypothetical protein